MDMFEKMCLRVRSEDVSDIIRLRKKDGWISERMANDGAEK